MLSSGSSGACLISVASSRIKSTSAISKPVNSISKSMSTRACSSIARISRSQPAFAANARVSSTDQDFEAQVERLKAAGCDRVYSEKAPGKSTNGRHALDKAIKALLPGDTLVTVRLDRLARSIRDLLSLLDTIKAGGAYIKALDDPWLDTTTPHGELILTVMGGLHEFERKLIRQRCDEGIKRAKAK